MKEKLLLIDGNSIINRAYFALPPLNDKEGRNVNAVYGFVNILMKVLSDYSPDKLIVTFDKRGHNFRKDIYPQYKANRKGMPDDLAAQMPVLHDLLDLMRVKVVEKEGVEADDIIGTLVTHFQDESCYIVTGDRDLMQLTSDRVTVLLTKKGVTEVEKVTVETLFQNYNMTPNQVVDYKALRGDTSDNIPGVRGIGDKTAIELLKSFGDLDTIYLRLGELKGAVKDKLEADREMAYVSRKLATIVTDADVFCDIADCTLPVFDSITREAFANLQFRSLLSRLKFNSEETAEERRKCETIEITQSEELSRVILKCCEKKSAFYFDGNVYLSTSADKQYLIRISDNFLDGFSEEKVFDALEVYFAGDNEKAVYDSKALRHLLYNNRTELSGVKCDVSLMQYLAEYRSYKTFDELAAAYGCAEKAAGLYELAEIFCRKLVESGTEELYTDVELPLSKLLYEMEKEGVKVNVEKLDALASDMKRDTEALAEEIQEMAGERFNVASPKQLSVVLFEKLGLKHSKKTATGYSTKNDVLEKLIGEHPVIEKIIEYRKLSKLYGTYVEGLKPFVKRGIVHTTYNQAQTVTGRLSSSDPNLQNIPIRNEQGREIRKLFESKYGVFVGADYSQIELRLLASFSGDENLLKAFNDGEDIHAKVASEIMGVPQELVTKNMRRMAKAVNFGIIYGISDFGLSENTGISYGKAHEYIKLYFERFPRIKEYLDGSVAQARKQGYVTTITGRRRAIPEINSSNFNLRSFGERAAMNMPLQGSAADIMKIAMLKVDKAMKKQQLKSKIVMQIHDELIVDCFAEEIQTVKDILVEEMQTAVKLPCKLTVDTEEGKSLYEA